MFREKTLGWRESLGKGENLSWYLPPKHDQNGIKPTETGLVRANLCRTFIFMLYFYNLDNFCTHSILFMYQIWS